MENQSNPLKQYFRKPGIWIKLPSQGEFYNEKPADFNDMGEIPVYPMTAKDELTLKTPDALLSGQSTVEVIKSCIPAILDPWKMPSFDLDAVLIAIRVASYGHEMELDTSCPNCAETTEISLDLRKVLERLSRGDYSEPVKIGDLEIHFKPLNYRQITSNKIGRAHV